VIVAVNRAATSSAAGAGERSAAIDVILSPALPHGTI
jgi:hypothetical protein